MPTRSFADRTLLPLLDRLLTATRIRFTLPDGDCDVARSASGPAEPDFIVRVTDPKLFHRMWELYLAGCVAATIHSDGAIFQIVATNDYRRPLPLHRVGKI